MEPDDDFKTLMAATIDLLETSLKPAAEVDEREILLARRRFETLKVDPVTGADLWQTLSIVTVRLWAEDTGRSLAEIMGRLRNRLADA